MPYRVQVLTAMQVFLVGERIERTHRTNRANMVREKIYWLHAE